MVFHQLNMQGNAYQAIHRHLTIVAGHTQNMGPKSRGRESVCAPAAGVQSFVIV